MSCRSTFVLPKRLLLFLAVTLVTCGTLFASFESVPRVLGSAALPRDPTPYDVDGDGDVDVFYVDGSETTGKPTEVGWFENRGGGTGWTRHVMASGLRGPSSIDVADLDGDGKVDLVIGTRLGDGVLWCKGQGNGAFAASASIQAIFSMEDVTVADLNKDGKMDIIISTSSGPKWLRQNTTGFTFATPAVIANMSGSFPEQCKCKPLDYDKDGDIDLVFALGSADKLIFCRNNGNGTFAAAVNLGTIKGTYALAVGDLDSDGFVDVVSGSVETDDKRVVWFKNQGNGSFSSERVLDTNLSGVISTMVADFDRDGDLDIGAAGHSGPIVWYERQPGAGVFSARQQISQGGGDMRDMVHGDLDGDGDNDLMAVQWENDQFVWYSNTTPPIVVPPPQIVSFTADDTSVASSATLRWQTSGATEVEISPEIGSVATTGNRTFTLSSSTNFTLTARNAGGTSTAKLTVLVGEAPRIVSFTALDETIARGQQADLTWDVAGAASLNLSPVPGVVTGTSYKPQITSTTTFTLRAVNEFGETTASKTITAGDPPTISSLTASPSSILLNQNSVLAWTAQGEDTAVVSGVGEVPVGRSTAVRPPSTRVYTVTVSNAFGTASRTVTVTVTDNLLSRTLKTLSNTPFGIIDVDFADINRDGLNDLLQVSTPTFTGANFNWRPALAAGGYGPAVVLLTSPDRLLCPTAYDMDGDGDLDPLVAGDGAVRWYPNQQNGASFGTVKSLGMTSVFRRLFIGDLNKDGLPDFAGGVDEALRFFPGTPGGGTGTAQLIDAFDGSVNAVESAAADMDGDGDLDLVAGKDFDGEVYWFQNNGGLFTNRFPVFSGGERIFSVAAADTDGNGDMEVLIRTGGGSFTLMNGQNGNFTGATATTINTNVSTIHGYKLVDLDMDGDLDLAVVGRTVSFVENRGNNQFVVKDSFSVQEFQGDPDMMTVTDVDRDGDQDLVVANSDVLVWLENLYRPAARPLATNYFPKVELEEDFGEFMLPLSPLVADADTPLANLSFSLRGSNGATVFSTLALQAGPPRLRVVSAADLNGLANATLRATDPNGLYTEFRVDLTVNPVPDAPRRVGTPPPVTADAAASPVQVPVSGWFSDPDAGDRLSYAVTKNTQPGILKNVAVGESDGMLAIEFAPYVSGSTVLEVTATDLTGRSITQEMAVNLPDLPPPSLQLTSEAKLNRQTGLYEQTIRVTNTAGRALGGFHLQVAGLPAGVKLKNTTSSGGVIDYLSPLGVGETVELVLEYEVPDRSAPGQVNVSATPVLPAAPQKGIDGLAIDRIEVLPDRGGVLIEFTSKPGTAYAIEYLFADGDWRVSPVTVLATANRTQWIDRGPPHTATHPAEAPMRLYRVRELAAEGE